MPEVTDLKKSDKGASAPTYPDVDVLSAWGLTAGEKQSPSKGPGTPADGQAGRADGTDKKPAAPADLFTGWPQGDGANRPAAPNDRVKVYPVKDGVLEINFNDLASMSDLPKTSEAFTVIKVTGKPADVQMRIWADEKGFYFFYTGATEAQTHHFPTSVKEINDGQRFDVAKSCRKVVETALAAQTDNKDKNPFGSVKDSKVDALVYFQRMSKLAGQSLDWGEQVLKSSVAESKDPYLHMYLGDILTMQALRPIVSSVVKDQPITAVQKQEIMKKLGEAQDEYKKSEKLSYDPLYASMLKISFRPAI